MSEYKTIIVYSRYGLSRYGINVYGSYEVYAEIFTKNGIKILFSRDAIPSWEKDIIKLSFAKTLDRSFVKQKIKQEFKK